MAKGNRQFIIGVGWLAVIAVVGLFTWKILVSPEQAVERVERVRRDVAEVGEQAPKTVGRTQTVDRSSAFEGLSMGTPVTDNAVYAAVMTPEKQGFIQGVQGTVIEVGEEKYLLTGEDQVSLESKPIYLKSHPESGLVKLQILSLSQVESNWLGKAYKKDGNVVFVVVEEG